MHQRGEAENIWRRSFIWYPLSSWQKSKSRLGLCPHFPLSEVLHCCYVKCVLVEKVLVQEWLYISFIFTVWLCDTSGRCGLCPSCCILQLVFSFWKELSSQVDYRQVLSRYTGTYTYISTSMCICSCGWMQGLRSAQMNRDVLLISVQLLWRSWQKRHTKCGC